LVVTGPASRKQRVHRFGPSDRGELHLLLEAVAGHVLGDLVDHLGDRGADGVVVGVADQADTVSRMMSGGSAGLRTMIALPRRRRRLLDRGAVVSVNSSMFARVPGPGRLRGDRGDDLGVRHRGDPGDRRDDRDGGLAAAGHHVELVGRRRGARRG
jgi:hypothetical protein